MSVKNTKALCPVCFKVVSSEVIEENGQMLLKKYCPEHGHSVHPHFWKDPTHYKLMSQLLQSDKHSEPIVLVMDLTYRCNQNCNFCYVSTHQRKAIEPTQADILKMVEGFRGRAIYLGGGEPTLRSDLFEIIGLLKKKKYDVTLMTNGKKLVDIAYVRELRAAGLDTVHLQFDTLNDGQYVLLRNEPLLEIKLKAVENSKKVGLDINLWVMMVKGINDDQIGEIVRYAAKNSDKIKMIFFASSGKEGIVLKGYQPLGNQEILHDLNREFAIEINDFMQYKQFDFYLFSIINIMLGLSLKRSSNCGLSIHLIQVNGKITPITKLAEFSKINEKLKLTYERLSRNNKFTLAALRSFPVREFLEQFLLNPLLFKFTIRSLWSIFKSNLLKTYHRNDYNKSFYVEVRSLMDRNCIDFEVCTHCNDCTIFKNKKVSFCNREIMRETSGED